jgi:hypothetical protein
MEKISAIQQIRAAIKDRALYLALLYQSYSSVLPAEKVEEAMRKAIFDYGQLRGEKDHDIMTPEKWVDRHISKGSAEVFVSKITRQEDYCVQEMTYCPLVEAWQELGCTPEQIDSLCDIAMEVDRGRAAYHDIPLDITHRLAKGDESCRLVLRNKPAPKK